MSRDTLQVLVVRTAAHVLGVRPEDVAQAGDLTEFSTYTSFRALDIVESLEQHLGVEVDAPDLVPHNLRSIDALCRMFQPRADTGLAQMPKEPHGV
ncbi:acyl carrier protein [Streptomyces sp. BHT-5-2]|uniref:phosphopantetheine-binding protein n=1 Tax=Streptomyces sp. BHT-5-2 TaxID=2866715 RepID=UPI001C8EB319|nr:phosphopantetheine-binding protein [Streptomyces sp. BHT-5-2]QZL04201.1 acyl carrier protein [Streptomyces sp. BHT-5-2]